VGTPSPSGKIYRGWLAISEPNDTEEEEDEFEGECSTNEGTLEVAGVLPVDGSLRWSLPYSTIKDCRIEGVETVSLLRVGLGGDDEAGTQD
jgi:hypothetical protein